MVNKLKNEHGYALVTVLLIITIFMLLAASFMTQSSNTRTQISSSETRVQSIDLAEMGIEYYKLEINEELERITTTLREDLMNMEEDISTDNVKETLIGKLNDMLYVSLFQNSGVDNLFEKRQNNIVDGVNSYKIEMDTLDFEPGDTVSEIHFKSTGIVGDNENENSTISAILSIDFNYLNVDFNPVEDSNPNLIHNLIQEPTNLVGTCNLGNLKDFDGENCLFDGEKVGNKKLPLNGTGVKVDGDLELGKQDDDWNGSVLYVVGDLDKPNNGNWHLSNGKIFVGGDANFGNFHGKRISNVTIEVKGTATFHNKIEGTNVLVCANTVNGGPSGKVEDNYVGDPRIFSKTLNPDAFEVGGPCASEPTPTVSDGEVYWDPNKISEEKYEY